MTRLDALNDDAIDSLLIDREHRLWVGSKGALYLYDREKNNFQLIGRPGKNLPAVDRLGVTALKQDRFGRIWASTVLGLLEVKPKIIQCSSKQQALEWELVSWKGVGGVPDDVTEAMQDAENGDLWMSTERGLMRVRPSDKSGRNYPSLGRFEGAFNFAAAARGPDGNLFFGGVGLVSFHPDAVWDNKVAPRVILSDILLFNRSLANEHGVLAGVENQNLDAPVKQSSLADIGISGPLSMAKKMQLDHSQSMISFELSALHFYDYAQNRYAWKLEGYDEHWIVAQDDRAVATYTNLDPRTYTLLAKAANPDGVWSDSTVLMQVTVLPPYWRTWWWYLSWLMVVLAMGYWLYRNRLQRIRQHEHYLAHRVQQQTQEILSQKNRADMQRVLAERARNDIGRLSEVGLQITASLDVKCILDTLYSHIFGLIDASTIGVGFVDWDSRQIKFDYCMQGEHRIMPYVRSLDAPEQPASQCVLQGKELIIDEIHHDSSHLDSIMAQELGSVEIVLENGGRTEDSRSGIYVPIMHGGRVLGVIGVMSLRTNAFGQNELNILRTLATYVAVAYDNAEAYRRLELTQSKLVEQEKMAALGSLVAGVAHELNTPIGNSLLMASTIRDVSLEFLGLVKNNQLRRSDLESFCHTANNSSELLVKSLSSAASLVSSFKQIAVDQTSDQRRHFELLGFCEELAMTLASRMKREGHEIRLDISNDITLDSYPGAMGQVLSNLIINAIVHGFDGRRQGIIEVQGRTLGEHLISLSIRDNGQGISEEHLPRIFEPFFTTRLGEGGSGLGLHICYNIIMSILGGSIEVESERGRGTVFVMTIPKCAPFKDRDEATKFDES
ncbi:MAG: GAF domain-containing protein [Burkholderiales bacterium]|nr:GAF domain-containing protein [Burkholderiales bacterium]